VNPSKTLAEAWRNTTAADYEDHMSRIGQAQANARLTARWIQSLPPAASLLIAGAGPGQMLPLWSQDLLANRAVTFSDFQPAFLATLSERLKARGLQHCATVLDDITATQLPPHDAAVITLVLEHVDWRKALESLSRWHPKNLLIIIQENPASISTAVSPTALCLGTMRQFKDEVRPHLIPHPELRAHLFTLGYSLTRQETAFVADGKMMHALWLSSAPTPHTVHQYRPELAPHFERLNREWLEKYFKVEPPDLEFFADPYGKIVAPGGQVFFLENAGQYMASAAAVPCDETTLELGKLAVTAAAQGQGYGKLLALEVIEFARREGCARVVLHSDSKLETALKLYLSLGFQHLPHDDTLYDRGDITMELRLN
jgi:GNAT superfamily N-acetyltransferase